MAFSHGSKAVVKVGDSGNTLQDISAYCNDADFPSDIDSAETTTFGKTAKTYIPGLSNATISLSGEFDPAVDAILAGIIGKADRSFEFYPVGLGTGNIKYNGSANLTKYDVHSPIGGEVTFSAELQVDGVITRTVL